MNIPAQILTTARLTGDFTLRSGARSTTYFDKYLFESNPFLLKAIVEVMSKDIPKDTEILAGLEMGGIPVVTALSQVTGLPCAFIARSLSHTGPANMQKGLLWWGVMWCSSRTLSLVAAPF